MRKLFTQIFKDETHLERYWWYRLIRVLGIAFLGLIAIGAIVILIVEPPVGLLSKHNTHIKYSIYEYTQNYTGKDYENTIPKFTAEKGSFGILNDGKFVYKTNYLSSYDLGDKSFCVNSPEKYIDGVAKRIYEIAGNPATSSIEEAKKYVEQDFIKNPSRKCYFIGSNFEDIQLKDNLSNSLVNFRPNIFYYFEVLLMVLVSAFLLFAVVCLIYWGPIRYIIYGKNK